MHDDSTKPYYFEVQAERPLKPWNYFIGNNSAVTHTNFSNNGSMKDVINVTFSIKFNGGLEEQKVRLQDVTKNDEG
jgi:hypothetical protein